MRTEFRSVALLAAFAFGLPALAQQPTAAEILHKARTTAAAEHKNIMLSFGASWCGNCRLLDRFLADPTIKPIMDKAFVFADVASAENAGDKRHSNNPGGPELMDSFGGKGSGVPYFVMLDPAGKLIVNSYRPDKNGKFTLNIGYPATPAEIDWFEQMLKRAAPSLTPQELATVRAWLTAHSPVH